MHQVIHNIIKYVVNKGHSNRNGSLERVLASFGKADAEVALKLSTSHPVKRLRRGQS